MTAPKVVVGTLTWNQKADVLECLSTLVKLEYPNYEIAVVDNGSGDGTEEAVRQNFPRAHVVRHTENLGCAEGVNGEIRYALSVGADYLLIIANDATVESSTLKELVRVAEADPRIGVVFPKVYYHGSEKRIWFARGIRVGGIDWLRGRFTGYVQNVEDDGSFDEEAEAHLFPGGFCLVRMEAVKRAGFLDPYYFIFFDDTDWLMRIHKAGFTGRYAPRARAWHKPSSSLGMESESFYYYRTRNRLFFYGRYGPKILFPFFFLYFLAEFSIEPAYRLLRAGQWRQVRAGIVGIADFLRGKRGPRDFSTGRRNWLANLMARFVSGLAQAGQQIRVWVKQALGREVRLSVRLDWNIGDEVMALPVYEAFKKKYSRSKIEARVKQPGLLAGNPFVDCVNAQETFRPDRTLDLHREIRHRPRGEFLQKLAGVDTWGLPQIYLTEEELEAAKSRWGLEEGQVRIALTPSARWFARRWPRENWTRLVGHFLEKYGARVFILGRDDEPLPVGIDLIGKTSLREAACLLKFSHLFVGSDSGLVHLACAAGVPTVGLFGPLNPSLLIPGRPNFTALRSPVECRGCWPDYRMKYPDHCPKILPDCMSSISVESVIGACEALLSRGLSSDSRAKLAEKNQR